MLGLLFFALGCLGDVDAVQYFGAAFIFGLIGLFEKNWLEEVEGVVGLEGGVAGDAGWGYRFLFFIGPY